MATTEAPPAAPAKPAKEKKEKKDPVLRSYGVYVEAKGTIDDLIEFLKENVEPGQDGTILLKFAGIMQSTPRKSMSALGDARDLNGDYKVIADNQITEFNDVVTEKKRYVRGLG